MVKQEPGLPGQEDLVTLNRSTTIVRQVAGVLHDLNNQLMVIGATAELLQDTPGVSDAVVNGLKRISAQNAKAGHAIAELMLFVRQKTDVRGRLNMRDLVTRTIALRSFFISRARLAITFDPPKTGRVEVEGYATQLQQAVLNLLVNAEQALAGQKDGAITVELELPEGAVVVRISDNGTGVDPAIAGQLFEPFATSRSRDESSGLGLAVARHIAEQHGGTLTMESASAGASFTLRLPAVP
jgi:signal transduction histidine kinase